MILAEMGLLWIVGQALRLPTEGVFPQQAGHLPYNRQRG